MDEVGIVEFGVGLVTLFLFIVAALVARMHSRMDIMGRVTQQLVNDLKERVARLEDVLIKRAEKDE